jgi:hypothetical protein
MKLYIHSLVGFFCSFYFYTILNNYYVIISFVLLFVSTSMLLVLVILLFSFSRIFIFVVLQIRIHLLLANRIYTVFSKIVRMRLKFHSFLKHRLLTQINLYGFFFINYLLIFKVISIIFYYLFLCSLIIEL